MRSTARVAAAMLDRLLHRSVVINLDGESYRLRDHQAAAETLRRITTGTRQQLHCPLLTGEEFRRAHLRTFDERDHLLPILAARVAKRAPGEPAITSPMGSRLGLKNWKRW